MAQSLGRSTAIMAAGTMTSRVLGFVKAILLTLAIGQTASISADAFNIGNALPGAVFSVLLGGMLNSVLVPQIVKAAKSADGGSAYINKLLTLVIVASGALTALAMLAVPWIVKLHAMEWGQEQLALAVAFAYWCMPQLLFYGIYTVMGEVLNARSFFGPYTWAPALNNVVSIAGIVAFIFMYGSDPNGDRTATDWNATAISLLAGTATLGVVVQALILFVFWRRAGIKYRPDFRWRGVGLSEAAKLSGWTLGMLVVLSIATLIHTNLLATASGVGLSTTAVNNAWLVMQLPHSIFVISLVTAYFTRLATAGAAGDINAFKLDFSAAFRQSALIMLFFAAVFIAVAPQISRVIQVQAKAAYIDEFALLIQLLIFNMVASSLLLIISRGFFALSDTRTPFIAAAIEVAIIIPLSFIALLFPAEQRAYVIVLIQGIGTALQAGILIALLRRRTGGVDGKQLFASSLKFALIAVVTAVCGVGLTYIVRVWDPQLSLVSAVISAGIITLLLGVIYFGLLYVLRAPEVTQLVGGINRRRR